MAVVNVTPAAAGSKLHVLVNPRLVEREGVETESEGCLSIRILAAWEGVASPLRGV